MTAVTPSTSHHQRKAWDAILAKYFRLWLVLVVLILGLAGYFMLRSPYQAWRQLAHTQALEPQLASYSTRLEALKNELAAWRQLPVEQRDQVDLMLPPLADLPNLLTELEAVATQAGFRVQAVAVGDTAASRAPRTPAATASGNLKQVRVTLNLTGGNYGSFKQLVGIMQSAWRVLRLDNFGFSSDDSSYHFELTAFYYPT